MDLKHRFLSHEDFHQSTCFAKVMESIGWSSILLDGHRIAVKQVGPVSLAKMQRSTETDFVKLESLRKRLHIVRTIIEPATEGVCVDTQGKRHSYSFSDVKSSKAAVRLFEDAGYRQTSEHYAHTKTAILDLASGCDELISSFPSKTRYNIKVSDRLVNRYEVIRFDTLRESQKEQFFSLHSRWSSEKKIYGFSNSFLAYVITAFGDSGWMIQAHTNDVYSGGMLVLIHDRTAYYFYTCTSDAGKASHVPTGLASHAFQLAIENGATVFDFCSVFDERYPHEHPRWKGFTQFKARFAPVDVYYPPSFSRWM